MRAGSVSEIHMSHGATGVYKTESLGSEFGGEGIALGGMKNTIHITVSEFKSNQPRATNHTPGGIIRSIRHIVTCVKTNPRFHHSALRFEKYSTLRTATARFSRTVQCASTLQKPRYHQHIQIGRPQGVRLYRRTVGQVTEAWQMTLILCADIEQCSQTLSST